MATRTRKNVTRRDAEIVLNRIRKAFDASDDPRYGPMIVEDWEWGWYGATTYKFAILWEGGPYDWTVLASLGGRDEEFGFQYDEIEAPAGLFLEPITGWALGIFPV